MNVQVQKKNEGQTELTVEVSVAETEPFLKRAADRLAQKTSIPGFRPGKAPMNVVKSRYGEMAIYEEALQDLVTQTLWKALKEKDIESVGKPEISVEKVAPGNTVTYKAVVAEMPNVELHKWSDIRVKRNKITVTDEEVEKVIEDLRGMQATEALVEREARIGDKVEVNFETRQDGIVIEGGKGTKYPLIIGKGAMIPGFEDQVVGLKAKDKKEFKLTFPKQYFQEKLAGKEVDFQVEVLAVYERNLPQKNDAWAKTVIGKTYQELLTEIQNNVTQEKGSREEQHIEQELVERVVSQSTFSTIPQLMLQSETSKMIAELHDDVHARNMKWEDYLQSIKKTEDELRKEFAPHAERRVKGALVLRSLGTELSITVSDADIDTEIAKQREMYKDNPDAMKNLSSPEYRHYLKLSLSNRKVMDTLKERLLEKEASS